jgi:hypothetical protein
MRSVEEYRNAAKGCQAGSVDASSLGSLADRNLGQQVSVWVNRWVIARRDRELFSLQEFHRPEALVRTAACGEEKFTGTTRRPL